MKKYEIKIITNFYGIVNKKYIYNISNKKINNLLKYINNSKLEKEEILFIFGKDNHSYLLNYNDEITKELINRLNNLKK